MILKMIKKKTNVLFIGSFKKSSKDGTVGGQMYACNSLVNSELKKLVNWILLDSTASTNLNRSFLNRILNGLLRLIKSLYIILFKDVDTVLAFCSSGHSFLEKGMILQMAKLFGKKTIISPRSGHLIDQIEKNEGFRKKANRIFKSCDYVICQGTFWKSFFSKNLHVSEDKLIIIPNWININNYINEKHGIGNPIKILFMGWIEENKGIWNLLEAVKELRDENFIVAFAGNGKEFKKLEMMVKSEKLENKVKLLNWVYGTQKNTILNEADIFVLPSFREGLPNALLEAMASCTAIITSDVGAIPDVVQSGVNGYLIKAGDTKSLVRCLKEYLNNKELIINHSVNALKTVREKNSLEAVIPQFQRILN